MKTVEITCATCGKISNKKKGEIDRQIRKGRTKFYCDLKCRGHSNDNCERLRSYPPNFEHLLAYKNNRVDKYTDFRWYIKTILQHIKHNNREFNIDLEYLAQLWKEQEGICPITKQKLILKTHNAKKLENRAYQASIDRIDNSKGYIKGNIRFVAMIFNLARNTFSDEEVIEFCRYVTENHPVAETISA